jgi:hypothetical protein
MTVFKTLRFPDDIAKIEYDGNNRIVSPKDQKRYFEILVKELPAKYKSILDSVSESFGSALEIGSVLVSSTFGESVQEQLTEIDIQIKEAEEELRIAPQREKNNRAQDLADLKEKRRKLIDEYKKQNDQTLSALSSITPNNTTLEAANKQTDDSDTLRAKKIVDKSEIRLAIALPLPNELSESLTHGWNTTDTVQADFLNGVMDKTIAGFGLNKILGQMTNNLARKPVVDPGYFQDYKSTEPRSFTFSWDLVPRNKEEAKTIREIIMNLKKYTLPSRGIDSFTMNSPHHFDVSFGNILFSEMVNMQGLVCTNIQVDYATDGAMQMTHDGMPKIIKLTMSFNERASQYNDNYGYDKNA